MMIDASQKMLKMNSQGGEGMNLAMKRQLRLEIETLQNAPRDADKLGQLLKVKERQNEEARHIEETLKG